MKQLSIEQKAKHYDKAIERAESLLSGNQLGNAWIYKLLPELAESEDERIELLNYLYDVHDDDEERARWIAWLEKQGEQKPVPKFKIGDTMRTLQEAKDGWTDGMPFVVSIDSEYYNCNSEKIAIKDQDEYEYPPMNRKHDICDSCDEQNPAWSEEDEKMLAQVIYEIEAIKFNSSTLFERNIAQDKIDWLKSLKERYTWKPSEEQIRVVARLRHCLLEDVRGNDVVILDNLLEQLKAL